MHPLAHETSDLAIWSDDLTLEDCAGGLHQVRGKMYHLPETAGDIEADSTRAGPQVHCEHPGVTPNLVAVLLGGRRHQIIEVEDRRGMFSSLRITIQRLSTPSINR